MSKPNNNNPQDLIELMEQFVTETEKSYWETVELGKKSGWIAIDPDYTIKGFIKWLKDKKQS